MESRPGGDIVNEEISQDQKEAIKDNLEFQLALQRANEETTTHFKDRIKKLKKIAISIKK